MLQRFRHQGSSLELPRDPLPGVQGQPANRQCPWRSSMLKVWLCSWWSLAAWPAAVRISGLKRREWLQYQRPPPSKYRSPKLSGQEHRKGLWLAKPRTLVEACRAEHGSPWSLQIELVSTAFLKCLGPRALDLGHHGHQTFLRPWECWRQRDCWGVCTCCIQSTREPWVACCLQRQCQLLGPELLESSACAAQSTSPGCWVHGCGRWCSFPLVLRSAWKDATHPSSPAECTDQPGRQIPEVAQRSAQSHPWAGVSHSSSGDKELGGWLRASGPQSRRWLGRRTRSKAVQVHGAEATHKSTSKTCESSRTSWSHQFDESGSWCGVESSSAQWAGWPASWRSRWCQWAPHSASECWRSASGEAVAPHEVWQKLCQMNFDKIPKIKWRKNGVANLFRGPVCP